MSRYLCKSVLLPSKIRNASSKLTSTSFVKNLLMQTKVDLIINLMKVLKLKWLKY